MIKLVAKIFLVIVICTCSFAEEWNEAGQLAIPSYGSQAVVLGSSIYIIGGNDAESGQPHPYIQQFNPYTEECQVVDSLPAPRAYFVAKTMGDSVLIFAGKSDTYENAISAFSWKPGGKSRLLFKHPYLNRIKATGGLYGNRMVLVGGYTDPEFGDALIPYIVEFEPFSGAVVYESTDMVLSNLPYDQSSVIRGNKMYLFGGVYNGVVNWLYQLDLNTRQMVLTYPNLEMARAGAAAVVSSQTDTTFLIGGYNETNPAIQSVEALRFFNDHNSNRETTELKIARKELAAASVSTFEGHEWIYAIGGINDRGEVLSSIERLEIEHPNTLVENQSALPVQLELFDNYPNPFNAGTTIKFSIKHVTNVLLEIVSIDGKVVKAMTSGIHTPGSYQIIWDGTDSSGAPVASNMYFYRLSTAFGVETKKMLLLK